LLWTVATSLSITLAMLVWAKGTLVLFLLSVFDFLPLDSYRLLHFLILLALLVVPLGRLGLAPSALARNRHGGFPRKEQS
jgi:hypothetical protein